MRHATIRAVDILSSGKASGRELAKAACGGYYEDEYDIPFQEKDAAYFTKSLIGVPTNDREVAERNFNLITCEECRVMLDIALSGGNWEAFRNGLAKHR